MLNILLFLIFLALSPTPLLAQDEVKAYKQNQAGVEALGTEDYQAAILNLELAHDNLPENEAITKNLAIAYNNYAMKLSNDKDAERAIKYFELAIKTSPAEESAKSNLANLLINEGYKFYTQTEPDKAISYLKKALDYAKNDTKAQAFSLLGEIAYYKQELTEAVKYWEDALTINPHIPNIREKLDRLKKELPIEDKFKETADTYFDIRTEKDYIKFDPYDIKGYLRDAYREVGRDFSSYPKTKIIVIVYSEENFKKLRENTPEWLGGLYDGKIRLPIKKYFHTENEFKKLIYHEYTHAVIYSLTKGNCPIWLNEGLAKYSETKIEEIKLPKIKLALKNKSLIPLSELDSAFGFNSSTEKVSLAYEEAYSIIKYIIYRHTLWHIRKILERLQEGKNFEEALKDSIYIDSKRLEKDWRSFLEDEYR